MKVWLSFLHNNKCTLKKIQSMCWIQCFELTLTSQLSEKAYGGLSTFSFLLAASLSPCPLVATGSLTTGASSSSSLSRIWRLRLATFLTGESTSWTPFCTFRGLLTGLGRWGGEEVTHTHTHTKALSYGRRAMQINKKLSFILVPLRKRSHKVLY